jgi:Ca2+-binding RTX toxin-like protein
VISENAGEGSDLVSSSLTFTLGDNLERLALTGTTAIDGTGNGLDNALTGSDGANVLSGLDGADTLSGGNGADTLLGGLGADSLTGGGGIDRMEGGAGDDIYAVDNASDVIVEAPDDGADLVNAGVSFTLGDNVERLALTGSAAINGTGNDAANVIVGNKGANSLAGAGGADALNGGSGADTLDGGVGADTLSGASGADYFVFQHGQAAGDVITDFAAGEHLELHGYGAGSTIARVVGSKTDWIITDGVTQDTEIITLSNKHTLIAGEYIFT